MTDDDRSATRPGSVAVARADPWSRWRTATRARVALGRAGSAMPTDALLAFELDHARARDAVHRPLDAEALAARLASIRPGVLCVHGAAVDRPTYLLRPDLGRRLDDASRAALAARESAPCDVAIVVADGLSAPGIDAHAASLVRALVDRLDGLTLGPIVVAEQARVALADEVGAALRARLVVVVIGERPGLTSPDSIGAYLTFEPRPGRHDAERNCVSNIRPEGLAPDRAAIRIAWLVRAALARGTSGVLLKDESGVDAVDDARTAPGDAPPLR